jgi:autotransporter-associated beta strand protein
MAPSWLCKLFTPLAQTSRRRRPRKPFPRYRPRLEILEDRLTPAVHEWTGLGANNLWSNSQNWTNGTPASDGSGDVDLVFHTNLTNPAQLVTQNDLTGLIVDNITFDATAGMIGGITFATGGLSNTGYTINGNTITIDTAPPGHDPFGIDIGFVAAGAGLTETFNAGLALINTDATFRSQQPSARLTLTGAIDLGTRTLTIDNTTGGGNNSSIQGVTISGAISNGNLLKIGSGTLDLSGNNSYANITANGGFVLAETNTALGAAAGIVTANDPGQFELRNGITVVKTTLNLNANDLGGGLGANGNLTNTFRGNVVLMAGAGGVALGAGVGAANASTRLVIDGVMSGATSTLSINGSGVIEFARNNTFTGVTNLNGNLGPSTLQVDAPAGLGAGGPGNETQITSGNTLLLNFNGSLLDTGAVPENILLAGAGVGGRGALRSAGNTIVTIPGTITFIAGAPWIFGVDGAAGQMTLSGVIDSQAANRALTKVGPGTLVVGGAAANTFQGGVFVNGGILSVQNTSATPLGTLAGATGGLVTVNNTGTLRVETLITIPNPVKVNTGGTLAGAGTVNNTVTSTGGTVSPGTSPVSTATLTVGSTALDAASTFRVQLNGTAAGTFDQLAVNGTVNLGNARLSVQLGFQPAVNSTFVILANDGVDAITGTFANAPEGGFFAVGGTLFQVTYQGGPGNNDVVLTVVPPIPPQGELLAVGRDAGGPPEVRVYNASNQLIYDFFAYNSSVTGGVRVAVGDVNGDGILDIITGTGGGSASEIRVFSGLNLAPLYDFFAGFVFNPQYSGGIFVAGGDINHDGYADIIIGPDSGSQPEVRAFGGGTLNGALLRDFFVLGANFTTGVRVGAADVDGDGAADIIVGAGPGRDPIVQVYSGLSGVLLRNFYAFPASVQTGVFVAGGDINHDGLADLFIGTGTGSAEVRIFDGASGVLLRDFFPFGAFAGGARVGAGDFNGDGQADLVVGEGPGGTPTVKIIDAISLAQLSSFNAFEQAFTGGIFVGA